MEVNDAAVVAQVLAGDREAFRLLVERHSRLVFSVAYRMTGDQHDAEEIVQETLLRAYKGLDRFELRSNFGTWVYRIATNCALDLLRRKSHMKDTYQIADNPDPDQDEVQLPAPSPGPERLLLSAEVKKKLAQALELLTPTERVAFTMRHMEGQSIEAIGEALNLKVSAAKNSVFRAVQKLRQQLEPLRDWAPGSPLGAGQESGQ
ncbi:MAG TPA: sigma-70 family RNA polymerase sigma factor [Terriglobales bacterium]|jgi:RNA polymerase sigma-70 factor (ECF subfamily)|nr:sigma-70 family RNA polymerase sigma factor [Terriglobales bacterium]